MFPLLPYRYLLIPTSLTIPEVVKLLSDSISPPPRRFEWGETRSRKPFWGTVSPEGFTLQRDIRYRNSFLPRISGRFLTTSAGVTLQIRLSLHPAVLIFSIVWVTSVSSFGVLGFLAALTSEGISPFIGLAPLGMLGFFYLMIFLSFGFEAQKAQDFFSHLFEPYRER